MQISAPKNALEHVRRAFQDPAAVFEAIRLTASGKMIERGNPAIRQVALTFDDGPHPIHTPEILDILDTLQVPATFFCIGREVERFPQLIKEIRRRGHVVANHTFNHPDLSKASHEQTSEELQKTSDLLRSLAGTTLRLFRPPFGLIRRDGLRIVKAHGLITVGWDTVGRDWELPAAQAIVSSALTDIRNGSIVLLHDGGGDRSQTVEALPEIISQLRSRGFGFVTVEQMLGPIQGEN